MARRSDAWLWPHAVWEASISDMAAEAFEEHAQDAKKNCPVSRALSGVGIHLRAKLPVSFSALIAVLYIFGWRASPMVNTE
jgi:hypothetical protein